MTPATTPRSTWGGAGARPLGPVVIPAAGAGIRLGGRAKALMTLPDGASFLARIVTTAAAAGLAPAIVVVGAPYAEAVAHAAHALDARVVVNDDAHLGMGSSIAVGFAAALADAGEDDAACAGLWPVDHPQVLAATVASLLHVYARSGADAVIPTYFARGGHPVIVARRLWVPLTGAGRAPAGARSILATARCERVAVLDAGVVRDIDRPEDVVALQGRA